MTSAHTDIALPARFRALRGGLVVSCQAYPGEPLRHPDSMARIAQSAVTGGAVGISAQGLDDIRALAAAGVDAAVVGKSLYEGGITLAEALDACSE